MPHIQRNIGTRRTTTRNAPLNLETEIARQLSELSESPFDPQFEDIDTNRQVPFLGDLEASIATLRGRETGTTPEELSGLEGLFAAADPTLRLEKAREFVNQIVGPRNEAAAIAAGFGRGPAALEATTRAGAELALPIVTEAGRQQAIANQFKIALSQASQARGESRDRAVFEAVAAKVAQGQTTRGLNLQASGLESEQEIARSNIGLSTQDRTLALLNQLRTIRTSQAQINAAAVPRSVTGGGGGTGALPGVITGPSSLERAQTSLLNQQSEAVRVAKIRAGQVPAGTGPPLSSFVPQGGSVNLGGGSLGKTAFGGAATPSTTTRKSLTGVSSIFA